MQNDMQIIPLHFDVFDSSLSLEEFIIAAQSTQAVIELGLM